MSWLTTALIPETTNGVKFSGDKVIGNTGLTYAGSSMLLEDTITYRVFFKAADKTNLPVVQYNNERLQKAKRADTSTTILRALRLRNFWMTVIWLSAIPDLR